MAGELRNPSAEQRRRRGGGSEALLAQPTLGRRPVTPLQRFAAGVDVAAETITHKVERLKQRSLVEADRYEAPLTVFGRNAVDRFFTPAEINDLLGLTQRLAA